MSCKLKPVIQSRDTGQWIPLFDSCQLTITWMPTIKLNTDCICLGHLANNARSSQGNLACSAANQSMHSIVVI